MVFERSGLSLPRAGSEYQRHSIEMRSKFPGQPKTISIEGFEFMTAPIGDLHIFFPVAAMQGASMSTTGDFAASSVYRR